jgi:acetyl esterase
MVPWRVIDRLRRRAVRALLAAPTPALRALAGGTVVRDGLTLDPQVAAMAAIARRLGLDRLEERTIDAARAYSEDSVGLLDADLRAMAQVIDTSAPGPAGLIPVRVYRPRAATAAMILYFHGGGGVIGSIDGHDAVCRLLADETRCVVASVGYRLAPEHPHPAALDDALAAWRWARAKAPELGVDPARIALAGDSMGGFLAACVERRDRSAPRPAAVALIYPLLDLTMSSPSIETFADGFLLTRALMLWFRSRYCPDPVVQRAASPQFWDDLAGAAPTFVITAGFDPLRDEGRRWADRLARAGGRVVHREHASLVHGFISMTGAIRAARAAVDELCADLRGELAGF